MIYFKIYDDTEESTHESDVRRGRILMAIFITCSFGIAILGVFAGDILYEIRPLFAFLIFSGAGFIYTALSYCIKKIKSYPFLYSNLSMMIFGFSVYITGLDSRAGITVLVVSLSLLVIYLIGIFFYGVDRPDKGT